MAVAITDPDLWILALDVVEGARADELPIPRVGTADYEVELAEVVLLLVQRLDLDVAPCGRVGGPHVRW